MLNFKKIPKSAALAILIIIILECASWFTIRIFE